MFDSYNLPNDPNPDFMYDIRPQPIKTKVKIETIAEGVAHYLNLSLDNVMQKSRKHNVVYCRQLTAYIAQKAGHGPSAIASFFERDHTTIIHSRQVIEGLLFVGDDAVTRDVKTLSVFTN